MINENRTKKYLLYAIGEIILVVIGILIALQINNWNENRKLAENQRKLYSNLKIDFKSRLIELNEIYAGKQESIEAIIELNKIIANKADRPNDSIMDYFLSRTVNGFKFNEDFKMLDVVFNTGLINDVKNENLKRQLIEYPQKVEEMLEEQRMHNILIDYRLVPFYSNYLAMRDIYRKFDFRQYNLPGRNQVTMEKNYDGLLSSPLFENFLAESEMLIRVTLIDIKKLMDSVEVIVTLIEAKT
ncbi:DUF6090 family protein [Croceiramulus getboli]|nr:DUF6090 family protein [Flavobacteriaceae bacterium YJPT1-3]